MKVLVAHNFYRSDMPSGENDAVEDDVALLRDAGVHVETFFARSDDLTGLSLPAKASAALGPVVNPHSAQRLAEVLRTSRPDVLHVHNVFPLISPAVVRQAHAAGVPVVQTVHNYRHSCLSGVHFRDGAICLDCPRSGTPLPGVRHRCYRGSRAQSTAMAIGQMLHHRTWRSVDCTLALTPFMLERLHVAGFDVDRLALRRAWVDDPGVPHPPGDDLLYLGRLDEVKGFDLLLAAWETARERSGDLWEGPGLRIAGSGPLQDRAQALAARDGLVTFLGRLDPAQVRHEMRRAGAVVVPSRAFEGFPRVIVEALAAGRPVLVHANGNLETLVTAETGHAFAGVAGLAALLPRLRLSADLARSRAARRQYEEHHSKERVTRELLHVYERLRLAG